MTIYIILIIIFSVLATTRIKDIKETNVLRLSFMLLYFLSTVRSIDVGSDTHNYYDIFCYICKYGSFTKYAGRFEIGYLFLNKAIAIITNNFTLFLAVINIIIYYAYYLFIKKYSLNYGYSVFLFFVLGYWGQTVNIIRLELAVAMFIYAYILFEKDKKLSAFACGIFGVSFQRIALVFFLIFFVPRILSKRFVLMSTIITLIVYVGFDYVVGLAIQIVPYYGSYLSGTNYVYGETKASIVILLLMHLFIFAFCSYRYKINRISLYDKNNVNIQSQLNMTYVSALILFLATKFNLLDRCEKIFGVFILLLLPNILSMEKKRSNYLIMSALIIIVGISYFFVINYFKPEWNTIIPYHTFLYDY